MVLRQNIMRQLGQQFYLHKNQHLRNSCAKAKILKILGQIKKWYRQKRQFWIFQFKILTKINQIFKINVWKNKLVKMKCALPILKKLNQIYKNIRNVWKNLTQKHLQNFGNKKFTEILVQIRQYWGDSTTSTILKIYH